MGKLNGRRLGEIGLVPLPKPGASRFGFSKGQDMVEFAMVLIFFLVLCFAVMEFGWLMFAELNVQQAVDDGGRYASTGQETSAGARIQSIIDTIQNEISIPGVDASNVQICSVPSGAAGPCSCSNPSDSCYNSLDKTGTAGAAGNPGDTVTLTLNASVPLLTPVLSWLLLPPTYTFTSSATFKNESFDPSTTK